MRKKVELSNLFDAVIFFGIYMKRSGKKAESLFYLYPDSFLK